LRFKRSSNYSFGNSERVGEVQANKNGPGPGNYDSHFKDMKNAPNYGFGSGTRE
jgi:hypothetical protein